MSDIDPKKIRNQVATTTSPNYLGKEYIPKLLDHIEKIEKED